MDHQTISCYVRAFIAVLIGLGLMTSPSPALADGGTGGELTVTISEWELPTLPRTIRFPAVDHRTWDSTVPARTTLKNNLQARMTELTTAVTQPMDWTLNRIAATRGMVTQMRDMVGDPMLVVATDGYQQTMTLARAVQQMSDGIQVGAAYLRAISRIGPTGLNLTFLFAGLIWIIFINFVDFLLSIGISIVRVIIKLTMFAMQIMVLLFNLLQLIIAILDLLWPF